MKFELLKKDSNSSARLGKITTDHGTFETPIFMPVATSAAIKGVHNKDLVENISPKVLLSNTYHLYLRPGENTIIKAGSNINCECPQHLSEIIGKLVAFEKYSSQCEARNPQDAEIHTLLEEETSKCRHAFEKLLVAVANFENIEY